MEDLTKTQIVLLTLLISFVTSIATGIVTVTLVDQAPPGVTQTINRVVERTVEKVVPGQEASVITKETTVVVKEEDLVIEAVDKNKRNVVLFETGEGIKVGLGFLASQDGLIVADSSILVLGEFEAVLSNQKRYQLEVLDSNTDLGITILQIIPNEDSPENLKFAKASFGEALALKLGQTVIALGGLTERSVATGIISKIETVDVEKEQPEDAEEDAEPIIEKVVSSVTTNISVTDEYEGSPLIDIDGLVVGINIRKGSVGYVVPSNAILSMIDDVKEALSEEASN